jgi:RNA polymerase sigma factor FliA
MLDARTPTESFTPAAPGETGSDEHAALWTQWHATRAPDLRHQLMGAYLPFARMLAAKTYAARTHDDVPFADYYQLASLGLIEAVDRYDPCRAVAFRAYAAKRIIGSILNGLAHQTEKTSQISEQQRLRRERLAHIKEMARSNDKHASDDPGALLRYLAEISMGVALGILLEDTAMIDHDAFDLQRHAAGPEVSYFRAATLREVQAQLKEAIAQLPSAQQLVVHMHYLQSMAFGDVADRLALSRGRISQLHGQALQHLRRLVRPPPDFDMTA